MQVQSSFECENFNAIKSSDGVSTIIPIIMALARESCFSATECCVNTALVFDFLKCVKMFNIL